MIAINYLLRFCLTSIFCYRISLSLYTNIQLVNTTESLSKLLSSQLKYYESTIDSVQGRRQIGILGSEALNMFPDAVESIPSRNLPGRQHIQISNEMTHIPIINKNIIALHGVAGLQELSNRVLLVQSNIQNLNTMSDGFITNMKSLFELLQSNVDLHANLSQITDSLEVCYQNSFKTVESYNVEKEKNEILIQAMEQKKRLEFEHDMLVARLAYEANIQHEELINKLNIERKLLLEREILQQEAQLTIEMKRKEYEKALEQEKLQWEKERITAEVEAKHREELAKEGLNIKKLQYQSELDRERIAYMIKSFHQQVSSIIADVYHRPRDIALFFAFVAGIIFTFQVLLALIALLRNTIQSSISRPSLVRETSYQWISSYRLRSSITITNIEDSLKDVILSHDDKERVIQLAYATSNAKRSSSPYRHLLLYGSPGTGKTLIAKKLSKCCGLDYAIMSGGDIGPLGEDGVSQINKLFTWAKRCRRGLMLFIDEAEAFLGSRYHQSNQSSNDVHIRHALNALLYQTGSQSNHFMLVLATNRPQDLDKAILDRIDTSLHIQSPGINERCQLFKLFFKNHIFPLMKSPSRWSFEYYYRRSRYSMDDNIDTDATWMDSAKICEGFSGREISKLFISLQHELRLKDDHHLSMKLLRKVINDKIQQHQIKRDLLVNESISKPSVISPEYQLN